MNIHHIGYLVDDIKASTGEMQKLGFSVISDVLIDEAKGVYGLFLKNNGYVIELIQPIDEQSPIYGLRKKYKNSPYHMCYKTKNISEEIERLCSDGYTLIKEPATATALKNSPLVAFLMSGNTGMIELLEESENQ